MKKKQQQQKKKKNKEHKGLAAGLAPREWRADRQSLNAAR
jgi:hypothetical protein